MDFRISADDRVGNQKAGGSKPQPKARGGKGGDGARVEPTLGQSMPFSVADERPAGGNGGGESVSAAAGAMRA